MLHDRKVNIFVCSDRETTMQRERLEHRASSKQTKYAKKKGKKGGGGRNMAEKSPRPNLPDKAERRYITICTWYLIPGVDFGTINRRNEAKRNRHVGKANKRPRPRTCSLRVLACLSAPLPPLLAPRSSYYSHYVASSRSGLKKQKYNKLHSSASQNKKESFRCTNKCSCFNPGLRVVYRYFLLFVDIIRKNQPERASIRSPVPQSELSPSLSLASLSLSSLSQLTRFFFLFG